MIRKINWDALGVTTSLLCAVHCAVLPLLFTSLPFLGIDFVKDKVFEYGMIGLAFLIGVIALSHGYRRHHHKLFPIYIFTGGFFFLVAKEWLPKFEIPLLIAAVSLILLAHYLNYQQCRNHGHCPKDDCKH
jgi:hypothetical protein